ncbi:conjugal transfer protein [Cronobacter sakazakii]
MTADYCPETGVYGMPSLVPDISGEDESSRPVPVTAGAPCGGCGTQAQRLWQGPGTRPVCTLCWLTLNLDSPTAAHGHLAWLPDAPSSDIINLQRHALIGLKSQNKAVRRECKKVWNWLARHAREVENMWGTSRAPEFAAAMRRLSPVQRANMQKRLEGCVLILPPDVFSDLSLLLPLGRNAENALNTPAWNTYIRSDLYAHPPHPLD